MFGDTTTTTTTSTTTTTTTSSTTTTTIPPVTASGTVTDAGGRVIAGVAVTFGEAGAVTDEVDMIVRTRYLGGLSTAVDLMRLIDSADGCSVMRN